MAHIKNHAPLTRCTLRVVALCALSLLALSCGGGGGGGGGIGSLLGGNTVSTVDPRFVEVKGSGLINTFYMSVNEVTIGEYWNVVGKNPANFGGGNVPPTADDANLPISHVSWRDAVIYCNLRSSAEGLTPCYKVGETTNPSYWTSYDTSKITYVGGNGYRLPSKDEWQYAAKGGDTPEGTTYAGSNTLGEVGWCGGDKLHEVKKLKSNGLLIYDMSGNVWEWTNDKYICGGGTTAGAAKCTVDSAELKDSATTATTIGFRVVRGVK